MSRIGSQPIILPKDVSVAKEADSLLVTGPKGKLSVPLPDSIVFSKQENILQITRKNNRKSTKALHGLTRSLLNNAVTGVVKGYQKKLELVGTGYRVKKEADKLILSVGFSHDITVHPTPEINTQVESNNVIVISGIDKQKVGQVAADIRIIRPPEPYKGKGIRYQGEIVRRKAGKAIKASA